MHKIAGTGRDLTDWEITQKNGICEECDSTETFTVCVCVCVFLFLISGL